MPSLASLEKLLALEPNDPFLLYGVAQEHAKLGNYTTSLEFYDRCLAADPGYCYAFYHKAVAQDRMGDSAGAIASIDAGLKVAARVGDAHCASELRTLRSSLE